MSNNLNIGNHRTHDLADGKTAKRMTLGYANICALNAHPCFLNNQSLIDTCQLLFRFPVGDVAIKRHYSDHYVYHLAVISSISGYVNSAGPY